MAIDSWPDHLAWCKKRALEYLNRGDAANAIASMLSDMRKHPDSGINPMIEAMGLKAAAQQDLDSARRFIQGFN